MLAGLQCNVASNVVQIFIFTRSSSLCHCSSSDAWLIRQVWKIRFSPLWSAKCEQFKYVYCYKYDVLALFFSQQTDLDQCYKILSLITPGFITLFAWEDTSHSQEHADVARLISSSSHRATFTFRLCLFVTFKSYRILGKARNRNAECKPQRESAGCSSSNNVENVRGIFSRLIILKCGGWFTMSLVNYAH